MSDFRVRGIIEVDSSRALRDLTKFQNKLKSTYKELKMVDKAVKELDKSQININVRTDKAHRAIDKLQAKIAKLNDNTANIKIGGDTSEAIKNVTALDKKIEGMTTELDIDVDTNLDHGPLDQITQFKKDLEGLDGTDIWIEASLDADKAIKKAQKLNAEIDDLKEPVDVDINTGKSVSALDNLKDSISSTTSSLGSPGRGGLIGAVALLATTLAPITAISAGVAGGMVSSFAVMGLSVGAFGGLAIPTIKEVMEGFKLLNTETKGMSSEELAKFNQQLRELENGNPNVLKAAENLKVLTDAYKGFAEELKPIVLSAFNNAILAGGTILEGMIPAATGAGKAIRDLLGSANENLKASEWQAFFDYLGKHARGFTTIWGETIGNFITGVANMIVAFHPLTKMVNEGFLSMSQKFRDWTANLDNNKSFQNFIKYVKENGPTLWQILGDVATAVIDIGKAVAPMGMGILNAIAGFGEWYSRMKELNPELVTAGTQIGLLVLALAPFAGVIASILGPIGKLIGKTGIGGLLAKLGPVLTKLPLVGGVFAALGGPVGILVGLLAAVGLGLGLTNTKGETAKGMWESLGSLWETIKGYASDLWQGLKDIYATLKELGIIDNFSAAIGDLADTFKKLMPVLKPLAAFIGLTLISALLLLSWAIRGIAKAASWLATEIMGLLKPIIDGFMWVYNRLIGHSIIPDIINGIKRWFGKLPGILGDLVGRAKYAAVRKFVDLKNKAFNAVGDMKDAVVGKVSDMAGSVRDKFGDIVNSAQSKFDSARSAVQSKMESMRSTAINKASDLVNGVGNKLSSVRGRVTGAFSGAAGWLRSAGSSLMSGLGNGIESMSGWVVGKVSSIASRIRGLLPGSPIKWGPLKSWNGGKAGSKLMDFLATGIGNNNSPQDELKKQAAQIHNIKKSLEKDMQISGKKFKGIGGITPDGVPDSYADFKRRQGNEKYTEIRGVPGSGGGDESDSDSVSAGVYIEKGGVTIYSQDTNAGRTVVKELTRLKRAGQFSGKDSSDVKKKKRKKRGRK